MSSPGSGFETGIVLLAAGGSSRLGRPKQLVRIEGRSLLRRAAEEALATGCEPIVVVIGAQADVMEAELAGLSVVVCRNEAWREGMASSLRAGLTACLDRNASLARVVFMLCDQPDVDRSLLTRLLELHESSGGSATACAVQGRPQVPAIFERVWFDELLALTGDEGARSILRRKDVAVASLELPQGDRDVDTVEDVDSLDDPGA